MPTKEPSSFRAGSVRMPEDNSKVLEKSRIIGKTKPKILCRVDQKHFYDERCEGCCYFKECFP